MTLALLRAGQQAERLEVNHHFVSVLWCITLERQAMVGIAGVKKKGQQGKSLNNDTTLLQHFGD